MPNVELIDNISPMSVPAKGFVIDNASVAKPREFNESLDLKINLPMCAMISIIPARTTDGVNPTSAMSPNIIRHVKKYVFLFDNFIARNNIRQNSEIIET